MRKAKDLPRNGQGGTRGIKPPSLLPTVPNSPIRTNMNQRTIKLSREAVRRYQEARGGYSSAFPFILIGIETALIIITLSINN